MKIQLDTTNKVIRLEESALLGEFYAAKEHIALILLYNKN